MKGGGSRLQYRWNVWLSVWAGPIVSVIAILLYILVLDIDNPSIKPRQSLENACASIIYIAHIGNIIAAFVLALALLQEERKLMALWMLWSILYMLLVAILIPMSCFTMLKSIPARIVLHSVCLLISIWSFITIMRIYRNQDSGDPYDWDQARRGFQKTNQTKNGHSNIRMSMETNVM